MEKEFNENLTEKEKTVSNFMYSEILITKACHLVHILQNNYNVSTLCKIFIFFFLRELFQFMNTSLNRAAFFLFDTLFFVLT